MNRLESLCNIKKKTPGTIWDAEYANVHGHHLNK